ncbi:hypothetical protein [Teredinibacter purpureus]|uniref:hypothetical protein n=1 Tax=Teredinibacter purpureus TaxID=2731756 RepID=UPI0005F79C8C|nr:hypothetical protein [Teredinibacter purpureus]
MAIQQVNLYLSELKPAKEWLTANSLMFSVVGVIGIYIAFYFIAIANLETLEQQVIVLENQQIVAKQQLDIFTKKTPSFKNNKIDVRLKYLRAALEGREQVGEIIEGQNLGNSEGFAHAMRALARQSMKSISLKKISLSDGGQYLQVMGETLKAEDVATYIQKLQFEPSFTGTHFGLLSVAEKKGSTAHAFTLGFEPVYKLAVERE